MESNEMPNVPQQMPPATPPTYNPNMKPCKSCGNMIAKNAKACPSCGAKNKKPIYKRAWFWVIVIIVIVFIIGPPSGSSDDKEDTAASNSMIEQESTTSITQFKGSCAPLDYKAIARNPSDFEGKYVQFRGKVIQVSESTKLLVTIKT